ncbi:E3 ubiquitin-protein ligase [Vairimorpha necatrix]|uniref:HECT-type E3 ubiquitin transferase n=1 Tax=Vairimorpha necatrix TaxID=6039 RepID=A0AAX4J918_9MICR
MILKDKYFNQLSKGCQRPNCLKSFCRKIENPEYLEIISNILCDYDDLFLCENTNKLFTSEICYKKYLNKENWCINLLFHFLDLHKFEEGSKNINLLSPYRELEVNEFRSLPNKKRQQNNKILEEMKQLNISHDYKDTENTNIKINQDHENNNIRMNQDPENINIRMNQDKVNQDKANQKHNEIHTGTYNEIHNEMHKDDDIKETNHKFCKYFNKNNYTNLELYFITSVLHILIKKYDKISNFNLGLVILRLYSLSSTYSCKDPYNLSIILQIFDHIHNSDLKGINNNLNKTEDSEMNNLTFEEKDCKKNIKNQIFYLCINEKELIKNDIFRLIINLKETLNRSSNTNIRESRRLEFTLNIFYTIYLINEKLQIVKNKKFYLTQLCSNFNFKEEFKFYRSKTKTILNYFFILPVHTKAELIKYENNDLMKASLQDAFFRSLFEGHTEPYLFITVSRAEIYKDSIKILKKIKFENVHKQLRITFKNEEGVDSGGIRKEYFQILSHEIKSDEKLFTTCENTLWIRDDCLLLEKYYCIGKILGIALYNDVVLNIPFPIFFFKKLLNKKTNFNDLKEIDSDLHLSLSNLKKLNSKEIEELDLNFTIVYTSNSGEVKSVNLDDLNRNLKVTSENVTLFVNKYADLFLNKIIKKQFESIKEGFYYVINKQVLTHLSARELEKIIIGLNNFNINEIRSTTSYNGYEENNLIIKYFWEIFENFNKKMKKKLLQFITGHDRIPVGGSSSLKLVIMKNGCDTDRLPSSQTCFNTLLLPEYSSKEKLEDKLKTALEMTAGFFLL